MRLDSNRRRATLSWVFVITMLVLCGVLGVLQYQWLGEVSEAARERLKGTLQANLERLSADFNAQIGAAIRNVLPADSAAGPQVAAEIGARYRSWANSDRRAALIDQLYFAEIGSGKIFLHRIDLQTGSEGSAEWPPEWQGFREWSESRLGPQDGPNRGPSGPPPGWIAPSHAGGPRFEVPVLVRTEDHGPSGPFGRGERVELGWLLVALNRTYLRGTLLPEVLHSHLGTGGELDYMVEVVSRSDPGSIIYQSDPKAFKPVSANPDASIGLLGSVTDSFFGRGGPQGRDGRVRGGRGPEFGGRGRGGPGEPTRWTLFVRHRAGSLEAVVTQARWRNFGVTAGVLLLMLASVGALVHYTRRAQRLAELQMDFVAGVSHELRTPLTVIHTAAYNLRGRLAENPAHVERYGALIQQESGRLKDLVEQVLTFAGTKAGNVPQKKEPVAVEAVIEEAMQSSATLLNGAHCQVETAIDPRLPLVLGDAITLRHAIQNLLANAVKYGTEGNWIGVFASAGGDAGNRMVEIRIADRGPGIPADEQDQIFDAFFRGRRALQDQIHGTGLGLSLVKQIVEAHGGQIQVKSRPTEGTEFVIRIPAAPPEYQDEFANTAG